MINKISSQLYFDNWELKKEIDSSILKNTNHRIEDKKIVIENIKKQLLTREQKVDLTLVIAKYAKDKFKIEDNLIILDPSIQNAKELLIDIFLLLNEFNLTFKFNNLNIFDDLDNINQKIELKIGVLL
jgi:hypothetical protein